MKRIINKKIVLLWMSIICFSFGVHSCKTTDKIGQEIRFENLTDGIFEGGFKGGLNSAKVKVTIKDAKIFEIVILEHNASPIGKKANVEIVESIIVQQSTNVDAVSGATNSSHVIINAVQDAISKSYK
jgi:uncharacterized protein with FMN-binding domain